jgi:hypothetical protein
LIHKLFKEWDLETWANVLEVVGFTLALGTFFISLFLRSEINKLKASYIFDKTIKRQIEKLQASASQINQYLNDYDNNRHSIRTEFSNCIADLQDLEAKLGYWEGCKTRKLIRFIKRRRKRPLAPKSHYSSLFYFYIIKYPNRFYQTTYDDVWIVYNGLHEVIRQMENIKLNKSKSL